MAPCYSTMSSSNASRPDQALSPDSVVISGMSGLFPMSSNVKEFAKILYNKINPLNNEHMRWTWNHPESTDCIGTISDIDRFDAQFFMVHKRLAEVMEPIAKKILEQSYQAIYDAGLSPRHLSGKRVGVYVAYDHSEWEVRGILDKSRITGYNMTGCFKVSCDGKTKSFDQNPNGCVKSDAISVLFLQKASDALRAYAEVVHVKNQFLPGHSGEHGQSLGFSRNPDITSKFLKEFYSQVSVLPQEIEYIEASGFATPDVDKAELQSIENVFCKNRSEPLLVGSVMSNIGFTDAASGNTAITKVLLAYNQGIIASNMNCESPRRDIAAIKDGRMRIITKHEPFRGTYAAVNCMSFNGVNSHILLRGYPKQKDLTRYGTTIPRLVTISARQKDFLKYIILNLKTRTLDPEEIALLHNIHSENISGHLGRGYVILTSSNPGNEKTVSLSECMEHSDDAKRPLWFVYSGMGSQWAGMGAQLMRIPVFAAAIERCHKTMEPLGIDLINIITSPDPRIFDNVVNSFVGIAAIQIGITDILNALQLKPEKIIGHSVGELGCAYADGCLTAEEMILSAYSRGKASNETPVIRGAMAAVGLGYQQLSKICPPTIEIACHNSFSSSTISGPEQDIRQFVAVLESNGIFAKEVPSANIAYHSRYISEAGPLLKKLLREIILEPKLRSDRWISTSVPKGKWDEPVSKYCSSEYLTNNLLNPVLFEETISLIPSNAVLVEIAPHGLLQAILKRALPGSCKNIPLTQRGHKDGVVFFLEAIGKLYVEGFCPQLHAIYPKVEFPVSVTTPLLSHFVQWNHSEAWKHPHKNSKTKIGAAFKVMVNIYDDEYSFLAGNVVQGKKLFPFAAALVAVWDTLAMTLGYPKKRMSVRFYDIHLYTQPILLDQKQLILDVVLHRGSGKFEVLDGNSKIVTGYSEYVDEPNLVNPDLSSEFEIASEKIYNYFRSQGYSYSDAFKSISSIDESLENAQMSWNDNWVTFIDGLIQLNMLKSICGGVAQPFQIRNLAINVEQHAKIIQHNSTNGKATLFAKVDKIHDSTRCGGVILQNLRIQNWPSSKQIIFKLNIPTSDIGNINGSIKAKSTINNNLSLKIGELGNIETLNWEETPLKTIDDGIKVLVEYAGINVSDANKATGVSYYQESEPYFGMDFSGFTENRCRVMGLVRGGAAHAVVWARPELLWPVPQHWTLEQAATVPLAYTQAFYYLCVKNELLHGWKVLVHGAAGALGQAAISIALAHGCRVFATVSDNAKKMFLLKMFPQLNESDVGNSRNDSFGDMILTATNGSGCNIVLSCVKGDLKNISLKCVAFSGVTIDFVQIQEKDKFEYGMFNMTKQRSYIAADISSVIDGGTTEELKKLQLLVLEGISSGYVRPLTHVTYGPHDAPRAFRLVNTARHRGRVLLQLGNLLTSAKSRIVCSSNDVSIIAWDGSAFGLQLADRLIARGAKKLRFLSFEPNLLLALKMRLWQDSGVDVKVTIGNFSNADLVLSFINTIFMEDPIEAIYITVLESNLNCDLENILRNFEASARIFKIPLKYFAVIYEGVTTKQPFCASRVTDELSATLLSFPGFKNEKKKLGTKIEEHDWNRSALDVVELALRRKYPVVFAQLKTVETPSLAKVFPILAGNENYDASLKSLVLMESIPAIQSFIKNAYHVYLDKRYMSSMTKKQLLQIEKDTILENRFNKQNGFDLFFSIKEHDELYATTSLLPMDTLIFNVDVSLGKIETDKPQLFIIPGVEGHYARFKSLCEGLKLQAFVLQPDLDYSYETPIQLAMRYSKILIDQFELKKKFYLLAHDFGIAVALELTSILESHGLTGTVYCVGDGPEELKTFLESELSLFKSESELQEALVRTIFTQMTNDPISSLETSLRSSSSWEDRVEACVRSLLGKAPHTTQYIRLLLKAAYERIDIARKTIPQPRALRSQLILLRASSGLPCSEPNSLQQYSERKLITHELEAPLAHAAADLRVPAIVNKHLDTKVVAEYENSNVCVPYLYIG